jgi:DNA invertase Pin-like site-specific DNA recombinase
MNNEKIQRRHLDRAAIIYVRQSSMEQVRHNLESQRRQYELAELARQLGFANVIVIDEDQGRSGSGSVQRTGFLRLLDLVLQGQGGAVFALEASRLARNNRDWHQLVDLCEHLDTTTRFCTLRAGIGSSHPSNKPETKRKDQCPRIVTAAAHCGRLNWTY